MASQSDSGTMQYTIAPSDSRRDAALDPATPFSHQSLGQALGTHLGPQTSYHRPPAPPEYRISPSPSPIHPHHPHVQHGHSHPNGAPSSSSSYGGSTSPQMSLKRKLVDSNMAMHKRRREAEEAAGDGFDGGQGAKHWTDEEKAKLFNWLMGPGQDEHWNSLRATKNSCLRECAMQVFGSKKTYQALKGCYERNFNLFKQIYAYESWAHPHVPNLINSTLSEADRLKEYERRLQTAKKSGCDVGNITARTIDHWHRAGWYQLFYTRWHGDPATTKPSQPRNGISSNHGGDDGDVDVDDSSIDFSDSNLAALTNSHEPLTFISQHPAPQPQPPPPLPQPSPHSHTHQRTQVHTHQPLLPPPPSHTPRITHTHPTHTHSHSHSHSHAPPAPPAPPPQQIQALPIPMSPHPEPVLATLGNGSLTFPPGMMNAVMQYLQIQTQTGKMKLDYLRRREEREEKESSQRRELERIRIEREQAEFEHSKQTANLKQKADRAIALLENPNVDPSVKAAAGEYLKKVFNTD